MIIEIIINRERVQTQKEMKAGGGSPSRTRRETLKPQSDIDDGVETDSQHDDSDVVTLRGSSKLDRTAAKSVDSRTRNVSSRSAINIAGARTAPFEPQYEIIRHVRMAFEGVDNLRGSCSEE